MIMGVPLMPGGESLISGSWPVAGWMLGFFLLNSPCFVLAEDPGLERRLGKDYRRLPRWTPKLKTWERDR